MKAAFITLGCKVNQYETNEMQSRLRDTGFSVVEPKEDADIYIVNSCTVTAESSRKSRQALRKVRGEHPNAVTVLTGCYSQAFAEELTSFDEADIILGNKTNAELTEKINEFIKSHQKIIDVKQHKKKDLYCGSTVSEFEGHTRAYVKIQDGCNRYCTYCIIPKSRGFSRSKPLADIQKELTAIAKNGYKEVVFVGINLSAYGLENGHNICDALQLAQNTYGIERFRLGSLEPDHITDKVIECLSDMDKFCPQFHLSLQSGCDTILKRMNRHYNTAEYTALCDKLKKTFPDLSLTTDIIVGFPGETEEHFAESMEYAVKTGFMKVHVFPFSPREGTPAWNYEGKVSNTEKARRCKLMQTECDKVREAFMQNLIGKTEDVLFETPKNGLQQGYTKNYTPVTVKSSITLTGRICRVKITGVANDTCTAELL